MSTAKPHPAQPSTDTKRALLLASIFLKAPDDESRRKILEQNGPLLSSVVHTIISNPLANAVAPETIALLLSKCAATATDVHGNSLAHMAAMSGLHHLIDTFPTAMLQSVNSNKDTVLMYAVACDNLSCTSSILSRTASNVNASNAGFDTALLLAVRKAATFRHVPLLLQHGCKVSIVGGAKNRLNALEGSKAVKDGDVDIVNALVARLAEEEAEHQTWVESLDDAKQTSPPKAPKQSAKQSPKQREKKTAPHPPSAAPAAPTTIPTLSKTLTNGLVVSSSAALTEFADDIDEPPLPPLQPSQSAVAPLKTLQSLFNEACGYALDTADDDVILSLDLKVEHLLFSSHQLAMLSPEQLNIITKILTKQHDRVWEAFEIQKRILQK